MKISWETKKKGKVERLNVESEVKEKESQGYEGLRYFKKGIVWSQIFQKPMLEQKVKVFFGLSWTPCFLDINMKWFTINFFQYTYTSQSSLWPCMYYNQ